MWRKRLFFALLVVLQAIVFSVKPAFGHERWFVDKGTHSTDSFPFDSITVAVVFGAIAILALAIAVERSRFHNWAASIPERMQRFLPIGSEWRVVATLTGVMLIANAVSGVYLASDLVLPEGWPSTFGRYAQALIGLTLLSQVSFALAGALVLVVAIPVAIWFFPAASLADYAIEYLALGMAMVFVGLSSCPDQLACRVVKSKPERFAHLPLPIMRIGLGLSLVVLALHNKLLDPDIALTFLDAHDLNFVAVSGFAGFSNLHFVFAAGVAELLLGVLIVAGILTRLATLALFGFFSLTLAILGVVELVGHLPLFGVALLLAYRGPGDYRLSSFWRRRAVPSGPGMTST